MCWLCIGGVTGAPCLSPIEDPLWRLWMDMGVPRPSLLHTGKEKRMAGQKEPLCPPWLKKGLSFVLALSALDLILQKLCVGQIHLLGWTLEDSRIYICHTKALEKHLTVSHCKSWNWFQVRLDFKYRWVTFPFKHQLFLVIAISYCEQNSCHWLIYPLIHTGSLAIWLISHPVGVNGSLIFIVSDSHI